jgi:hypothetical protein
LGDIGAERVTSSRQQPARRGPTCGQAEEQEEPEPCENRGADTKGTEGGEGEEALYTDKGDNASIEEVGQQAGHEDISEGEWHEPAESCEGIRSLKEASLGRGDAREHGRERDGAVEEHRGEEIDWEIL